MRTVFKILLAPVWLLLAIIKLAFKLAASAAAFVLTIGGGLLLVYDLILLIIGDSSKELMLQLLMIGGLLIVVPFLAGIMIGLLEAAQEPIKDFIDNVSVSEYNFNTGTAVICILEEKRTGNAEAYSHKRR